MAPDVITDAMNTMISEIAASAKPAPGPSLKGGGGISGPNR